MLTRWTLDDGIAFAHEFYSALAADDEPRVVKFAPCARAKYQAARAAFVAAHPDTDPPGRCPLSDLDEAAQDLAGMAHSAGIEFGVIAEQARQALIAAAPGPRIPWVVEPACTQKES